MLKGARQSRAVEPHMPNSARLVGFLCALAAPLCWSIGGLVFRSVEAGPFEAVFWRSLGHVLVFPAFLMATSGIRAFTDLRHAQGTALVVTFCVAGTFVLHVLAMMSTTVANVLIVQSTSPVLVAVLGWIVLGERVSAQGWFALALAFAGLAIVVGGSIGSGSFLGSAMALGVAACSACMVILTRRARTLNMQPVTIASAALAVLVALPFGAPFAMAPGDIALLLALGLIQMTLGLSFFLHALRLLPAAQVTLIALLEPVLGPVWVWLFKGEEPAASTIVGGALVLAALSASIVLGLRTGARPAVQPA
jgi:drug/metabolite transporter (DMT)-like permease